MISATGVTIAGLAGAFLLASTMAAGTDINQKFTAGDGSTVLITGKGDQPILVTLPDGTTANLTIETYDDGGAVRLTSGMIGTLPMTPSQLKYMGYVPTNAGIPSVVMSSSGGNGDQKYFPPPKTVGEITDFPDLVPSKPLGGGSVGPIRRATSMNGITHGALEKYDKKGKKHLGEFDPKTGEQTKPPKPGRTTKT